MSRLGETLNEQCHRIAFEFGAKFLDGLLADDVPTVIIRDKAEETGNRFAQRDTNSDRINGFDRFDCGEIT